MDFEEILVRTDRLDFPALAAGDGPVVVCWHGFPDHPETWGPLAERLVAAGRRVVAPYLRGFHPDTADELRYGDSLTLAADAAAVARALDPDGVDMIGHDIGAGMVGRVAAAWPETLRRGVTMAVPPPATLVAALRDPAQQQRLFYLWMFTVEGVAETVLQLDRRLIDHLWATWSPGLTPSPEHRERIHRMYGDERYIANSLKIYRANFDPSRHDPALVDFGARSEATAGKPLLVMAGADDGCIAVEHFEHANRGLAPGSDVAVLRDAGHFLHLEQPDEVAERVLRWFDGA
ncbi:alpha/beta fold hydrolase [Amycolatopsis sp. 195334CR]|uniref:alpha/beta fold hydrolase n=1 Tax=Amycolatopsis sp. 195334CR TaxID=2814588 RepID=UPI001A8EE6C5|nr:alpha/beta hydrolase [Amycolatopsis sp. 195334CR]MBN6033622.1 alpha/beta hydrolase [Amycolatopsis sp. 195334CR]